MQAINPVGARHFPVQSTNSQIGCDRCGLEWRTRLLGNASPFRRRGLYAALAHEHGLQRRARHFRV